MLSALSVAEFCRTEAARFAAISRLRASWRCLSTESEALSRFSCDLDLAGFFGTGGGAFFSSFKEEEYQNYKRGTHSFIFLYLLVCKQLLLASLITFKRLLYKCEFLKKHIKTKWNLKPIHLKNSSLFKPSG